MNNELSEAARILGKRGGQRRKEQIGREGYVKMGKKGGRRVSDLLAKGREAERKAAESIVQPSAVGPD